MKQQKNTEQKPLQTPLQDKGNGHTPGKLKVQYSELMNQVWLQSSKGNMAFINGNDNDNIFTTAEAKSNAARIVLCWNEHDQQKADNQKKEDTIKELLHCINQFIMWAKSDTPQMVNVMKKAIELYTKHNQP